MFQRQNHRFESIWALRWWCHVANLKSKILWFQAKLVPKQQNAIMICYNCSNVIPADSLYCPCCGIKLYVDCPNCGHRYSSQYKICNHCGVDRLRLLDEQKKEDLWIELTGSRDGTTVLSSKKSMVTSVNIPNSVTSIGDNAFSGCSKLPNAGYTVRNVDAGNHRFFWT